MFFTAILREFDNAIAQFPEEELKAELPLLLFFGFSPFFYIFEKFVNAAYMFAHTAVAEFIYFCNESIEEVAVVTHKYKRAIEVAQSLL